MCFQHSSEIWKDFPELAAGVLFADGIHTDVVVDERAAAFSGIAAKRLSGGPESDLPEIHAWRRAFSKMGLKPTQYRCASESLLRRFRKQGELPRIHPLIDLCNAVSIAFAIPVAVFDVSMITGGIEVRHATGSERYVTFSGEAEHPDEREVIFADESGFAHARRWTNRQSGLSAMRGATTSALIVAEAMHETAAADVERLVATLAGELEAVWNVTPRAAVLRAASPRFEF